MSKNKNKNKPQAPKLEAPKPVAQAPQKAEPKAHKKNTNPMAIKWPTDPWGFTRELRKAVCTAASRCAGSEEKKKLLDKTLEVAAEFLDASHEKKADRKASLMDKARREHVKTPAIAKKAKPEPKAEELEPELELELEPDEVAPETEPEVEDAPALEGADLEDALFGDEEDMEEDK